MIRFLPCRRIYRIHTCRLGRRIRDDRVPGGGEGAGWGEVLGEQVVFLKKVDVWRMRYVSSQIKSQHT